MRVELKLLLTFFHSLTHEVLRDMEKKPLLLFFFYLANEETHEERILMTTFIKKIK